MMFRTLGMLAVAAATLMTANSAAQAKDWIEKVEVKRDGIDVIPIIVTANQHGYQSIQTNSHRFLLRLYAKATSGKRIVAMKLGSFQGVLYFEADGNLWSKSFAHRAVANGTKRTVVIEHDPVIPVAKVKWKTGTPLQVCRAHYDTKRASGLSRTQILSKDWTVTAKAYFELDAVAARKNKAKNNKWNIGNTTNQRDGYVYDVRVTCQKGIAKAPFNVKTN
ncbi:hypothetical protein [Roseibium sp. RKSG952]|uniref:hypothetical protein n=1 Tax=Roseibium sp. RKSG952 TaxID=2529384 RepID=UPI0012BC007E|nr:hypothetical protein [Roseibium sp. RKSG952]MTI00651.1 hypothetical protein [Roseibium sp. RKSG952]